MQGRDTELGDLADRWAQARAGRGGVVLVAGEPGIGKSRLIWALQQHGPVAGCVPDPSGLFALLCEHSLLPDHPALGACLEFGPDDTVEQRLDKIDGLLAQYGFDLPSVVPLLAKLLAVPFEDRYPPLDVPAERQRQLTIDALVKIALIRATHQPVPLWSRTCIGQTLVARCADATDRTHATDPATAGLQLPPEFALWSDGGRLERLDLNRLDRGASVRIVTEIAGMPVPAELLRQLVEKADGVPLYLEELTKLVVEQGLIPPGNRRLDPARPPPVLAIPATLADSLTARLDRLADAKSVAQLGAAIGRQFSTSCSQRWPRRRRAWTSGR